MHRFLCGFFVGGICTVIICLGIIKYSQYSDRVKAEKEITEILIVAEGFLAEGNISAARNSLNSALITAAVYHLYPPPDKYFEIRRRVNELEKQLEEMKRKYDIKE